MQERRRTSVAGGRRCRVGLQPGGQDALDGAVGRVADRDRLGAGQLEPRGAVLIGQAEHALGGAQPEQRVLPEEFSDHRDGCPADLGGAGATPGRSPHGERDLLRRVVRHISGLAGRAATMSGDQLPTIEDLHHRGGGTDVHLPADVSPRHRVEGLAHLDVDVQTDRAGGPGGEHGPLARQRVQLGGFDRLEHHNGDAPPAADTPAAGDLAAPGDRGILHLRKRGPLPPAPERIPHIRHRPPHPRLVLRLTASRRHRPQPGRGGPNHDRAHPYAHRAGRRQRPGRRPGRAATQAARLGPGHARRRGGGRAPAPGHRPPPR